MCLQILRPMHLGMKYRKSRAMTTISGIFNNLNDGEKKKSNETNLTDNELITVFFFLSFSFFLPHTTHSPRKYMRLYEVQTHHMRTNATTINAIE